MSLNARYLLSLFAVLVMASACSTKEDATERDATETEKENWDGARSACSTGIPYTFESKFPALPAQFTSKDLPQCIARCGDTSRTQRPTFGNVPAVSALPSGACQHHGERCAMGAVRELTCPDGTKMDCSFTSYECHCEGSEWYCYEVLVGSSVCGFCAVPDAGAVTDGG